MGQVSWKTWSPFVRPTWPRTTESLDAFPLARNRLLQWPWDPGQKCPWVVGCFYTSTGATFISIKVEPSHELSWIPSISTKIAHGGYIKTIAWIGYSTPSVLIFCLVDLKSLNFLFRGTLAGSADLLWNSWVRPLTSQGVLGFQRPQIPMERIWINRGG